MKLSELKFKPNMVLKVNKIAKNFEFTTDTIVLIKISDYIDSFCIKYFDGNTTSTKYVSKDHKVEIIPAIKARKLLKTYKTFQSKNLYIGKYTNTIGSDPEIFVQDQTGNVIPAFNFLGSKEKPDATANNEGRATRELLIELGNQPLYWDGFQAEWVVRPNTCLGWVVDSIRCGLKGTLQKAKAHNPNAKLSHKTVLDIPEELLLSSKPEHVNFGCMPSLNIYGLTGLSVPGTECPIRMAGGHMHFGIGKKSTKEVYNMVHALDSILAVSCVSAFANFDDKRRRSLYGLAGEHRLPTHGLEYRTLSNAWLLHPLITNIVFDLGRAALMFGLEGNQVHWKCSKKETIRIIQECDVDAARKVMEKNKDILLKLLKMYYINASETIYNVLFKGIESAIVNPTDIEGNWMLNGLWIGHSDDVGKNVSSAHPILLSNKKVS